MPWNVHTIYSDAHAIAEHAKWADLVIGAVLIPGGRTPVLIRREMLGQMRNGAVIVDVAIDQGGCIETAHATTHTDPIYFVDDVLHYCVSNMPAAVPHTSTFGLTNATFPYLLAIADKGVERACRESAAIASGVNTYRGELTNEGVASSQELAHRDLEAVLA
jgi:alanine dehydrogenase